MPPGPSGAILFPSPESNFLSVVELDVRITATFLDDISHDIPHQNWGEAEWDRDFQHCKSISGNLPVLISPGISGIKDVDVGEAAMRREGAITPDQHATEWDEVMATIKGAVDIVAFQDGHVGFSHFMSPNACYPQAHRLYRRYCEHAGIG